MLIEIRSDTFISYGSSAYPSLFSPRLNTVLGDEAGVIHWQVIVFNDRDFA